MDSTKSHLLLFLFVLHICCLSALLEPPSNVTLQCKNLRNIVEWNYTEIPPGLKFRVDIGSIEGLNGCSPELWVDQRPLRADVSCFSHPGVSYFLRVTAVNGEDESVSSPQDGIKFGYSAAFSDNQICYLDLPPVNISSQPEHKAMVRFEHPCLLYNKLPECQRAIRKQDEFPSFKYDIKVVGMGETHEVYCEEEVCERTLEMNEKDKYCLKIEGELEEMSVQPTEEHYCIPPRPPPVHYTFIVVMVTVAAVLVFAFIIFMVYRKFTKPSSPLPVFIKDDSKAAPQPFKPAHVSPDNIRIDEPEPSSPTCLLPDDKDPQGGFSFNNGSAGYGMHRIGILSTGDGPLEDTEQSIPKPFYMDGRDLEGNDDEEEEEKKYPSAYEAHMAIA